MGIMTDCVYCGLPANSRDHLQPRSVTGGQVARMLGRGEWVHSCLDCNLRLNDSLLSTVDERRDYVHASLRKRHRRLLEMGWPDMEDFDELGPSLQKHRLRRLGEYAQLTARLAYPAEPRWAADPVRLAVLHEYGLMSNVPPPSFEALGNEVSA